MRQWAPAPQYHCSGDVRNQQEYLVLTEGSAWLQGIVATQSEKDSIQVILAIPWPEDVLAKKIGSTTWYAGAKQYFVPDQYKQVKLHNKQKSTKAYHNP